MKLKNALVAALLVWLVLWLGLINPVTSAPALTLVPFALLLVLLYWLFSWLGRKFNNGAKLSRRQRLLSVLYSSLVTALTVLSSLRQLDLLDIIILLVFAVAGYFYIVKFLPTKDS